MATYNSKILINTDDWGSILPSGDAKNAKTMMNRLAIIIFLVTISVGTILIILLILYRKHGWKTAWFATKSTSSRGVLPLGQRDAWYKVHPKPCRCPKSVSGSCEEMRKKQATKKAIVKKKKRTFLKTNKCLVSPTTFRKAAFPEVWKCQHASKIFKRKSVSLIDCGFERALIFLFPEFRYPVESCWGGHGYYH
uniref:Uncharacterized protein n=1 Tax=Romanomermis culicivorax TaxID=13658 RepID=A0A915J5S2_ROMCU